MNKRQMISQLAAMLEMAANEHFSNAKTPQEFAGKVPETTQSGYWNLVAECCIDKLLKT